MSLTTLAIYLLIGLAGAIIGGALSGIRIGGEALGTELSAYMGGLYGVIAGLFAVIIGLAVLSYI